MSSEKKAQLPFGDLFKRLRKSQDNKKDIQELVQLAIQIEFMTIPAYLTALYSISDTTSTTYQLLRSVVMEEMFHANQAANLLVAIGGQPKFTGSAVPTYPNYLPHANPKTTPYVGLNQASTSVFGDIFAAIEEPAAYDAPPQKDNYDTIAQAYRAIEEALLNYNGKDPLFQENSNARQRTNIYPGKFGGKPIEIHNMEEAKLGILEIMEQGEGSVPASGEYNPSEPYGTYNHYGKRTDGTYGPILGTPYEMSHFKKFRSIALDTDNFPETYPIVSNARLSDFENKLLIIASEAFDFAYSIMLDALERSFYKPKSPTEPDMFFAVVLPVMHSVLPSLARIMMTTPIRKNINAKTGPNGAPLFLYKAGCSINDLPAKLEKVVALANEESSENNNIGVIVSSLEEALISMKESISK